MNQAPLPKPLSSFPVSDFQFCHSCNTAQLLFLHTRKTDSRFQFPCSECEPQVKRILLERERWARGKAMKAFLDNASNRTADINRKTDIFQLIITALIALAIINTILSVFAKSLFDKIQTLYTDAVFNLQLRLCSNFTCFYLQPGSVFAAAWATYLLIKGLVPASKKKQQIVLLPSRHFGDNTDSVTNDKPELIDTSFLHAFEQTLPGFSGKSLINPIFGQVSLGSDDRPPQGASYMDEMDWEPEPRLGSSSQSPVVDLGEPTFIPPIKFTGLEEVLECVKLEDNSKQSWWNRILGSKKKN